MTAGFWLIVAIFALGLSYLLLCIGGWVSQAMCWIDERIEHDLADEQADWDGGAA